MAVGGACGLDGKNNDTATPVLTPADIESDSTDESGLDGLSWANLNDVDFQAPSDRASETGSRPLPRATCSFSCAAATPPKGAARSARGSSDDGTDLLTLAREETSFGFTASRVGVEMVAVVASPTGTGPLTTGHPVVMEQTITVVDGVRKGK